MNNDNLRENHETVGRAMTNTLLPLLTGFVGQTLSKYYRADWWQRGVLEVLNVEQRRNLPRVGNYETFTNSMDVSLCSIIIIKNWRDLFRNKMSDAQKAWLSELVTIRNCWAHTELDKFTDAYVMRALDTMALFCEPIDEDAADELRAQLQKFQAQHPTDTLDDDDQLFFQIEGDYPSWCEVMQPNLDVQNGTSKQSDFAADLAQVAAGTGTRPEYQDATEFFSRTYMTAGMRRLLNEAIDRLIRGNGEPIIEVKTSFGGGKTHSMMALYHLFNRRYNPLKVDKSVQDLLLDAQIRDIPKDIHIAVAVGTDINTERTKDIPELEGVQIHSLMGEIFSQLARSAERFDLYREYIQTNDASGVSPGTKDMREFFNGCGACMILLDELVEYGKKLYNDANITSGKYDAFINFLHELAEAIKLSERSMLVVSLPQSQIELGEGEGGREVLRAIEKHFGRLQSVWSPVEAHESFEIVRRRLFQPCRREKERDEICAAFAEMYRKGKQIFPMQTREARYVNRLKACYPIHPQLFDLLYERWATIETFQKTRGVLQLMAKIVHKLWAYHDRHPMIMPGSIPLSESDVCNELTRYLPGNWSAIINSEIDGRDSEPRRLENEPQKLQLQMARRLTRTIFMGSAPTARGQNVRGLDLNQIRLGVLMPNEMKDKLPAKFKDMLDDLKAKLIYLYSNETHSWFDNRPTLRKVAEQLEQNITADDVEWELVNRIKKELDVGKLFRAKRITAEPSNIPDEPYVQLVVMPPSSPFSRRTQDEYFKVTDRILSQYKDGTIRRNKNMLLFLAGEKAGIDSLKKLQRRLMAWTKLSNEREERNLDRKQIEEVEKNVNDLDGKVTTQISMAYCMLVEPTLRENNMREIEWRATDLQCAERSNIDALTKRLHDLDTMLWEYAAGSLTEELEKHLFKRSPRVTLRDLWEYFAQYIYAPRLYDQKVLHDAVREGVLEGFFGLADHFDELTGEYVDLRFNQPVEIGSLDELVVRREDVEAQLRADEEAPVDDTTVEEEPPDETEEYVEPDPTRFSVTFDVGLERAPKDVDRCMDEIVEILMSLDKADVKLEFVIESRVPGGIPEPEREALAQNCKQLKAKLLRFER